MNYLRMSNNTHIRVLLLIAAVSAIALTLTNPHAMLERKLYRYLFVVDITQSMNTIDAGTRQQYSRLDYTRRALRQSIRDLPCGSHVGLAVFTEHRAFALLTPIEICANHAELDGMIKKIDWHMAWAYRSEVSKGLYSSLEITEKIDSNTRLVFISDGHEAPPLHSEIRPHFQGEADVIRGFIAGIGNRTPFPIPRLDRAGNQVGFWQHHQVMQIDGYTQGRIGSSVEVEVMSGVDRSGLQERIQQGTEHLSSLKSEHLRRLASETGLDYMTVNSVDDFVAMLKKSEYAIPMRVDTDLRPLLGIMALFLLLLVYGYSDVHRLKGPVTR